MSKTYKIVLTNEQIQKIYSISDKPATQSSLMSILSYLIKYTDETTNNLTKSLSKLYKMYLRYHDKITRSYFYTLIKKLKEKELILFEDKKEDKKEDKENIGEPIENTGVEEDSKKPNNPTTNHYTYIYTQNTSSDVIEVAEEILKEMNIKSKVIKKMVLDKLANINLDPKGMLNYIHTVILDKIKVYYKARDKYKQKVIDTKNTYSFTIPKKETERGFNNFEAREMYENKQTIKDLENKLTPKESTSDITELLNKYKSK